MAIDGEIKKRFISVHKLMNAKSKNELWCGNLNDHDYRINPLFGDPRNLAPQTVFAGSAEDIPMIKYVAKATRLRVNLHFYEKLNAVHTWVVRADQENSKERKIVIDLLLKPRKSEQV